MCIFTIKTNKCINDFETAKANTASLSATYARAVPLRCITILRLGEKGRKLPNTPIWEITPKIHIQYPYYISFHFYTLVVNTREMPLNKGLSA